MAMALKLVSERHNDMPIIHFAPEPAIQNILIEKFASRYTPADFDPDVYSGWSRVPLRKIDLSRSSDYLNKNSVEGIVHSHVLEHVPGSIERVVFEMNESIAPGGFHLFCVPITYQGWYREDMNPTMPSEERTQRFNQFDHLRMFGDKDFEDRCLRLFEKDFTRIDLKYKISQEELVRAALSPTSLSKYTGLTPFLFIKNV